MDVRGLYARICPVPMLQTGRAEHSYVPSLITAYTCHLGDISGLCNRHASFAVFLTTSQLALWTTMKMTVLDPLVFSVLTGDSDLSTPVPLFEKFPPICLMILHSEPANIFEYFPILGAERRLDAKRAIIKLCLETYPNTSRKLAHSLLTVQTHAGFWQGIHVRLESYNLANGARGMWQHVSQASWYPDLSSVYIRECVANMEGNVWRMRGSVRG
ncbi:hypothetical protein BD309DRAFT_984936 [Dichomitus squalens]|nr:hypothetical protein BD309DRAFT_984936 [Dichomitus squalens]